MGVIQIYDITYLCVITDAKPVGFIIPGQEIYLIERVKLYPIVVSTHQHKPSLLYQKQGYAYTKLSYLLGVWFYPI